MRKTKQRQIFLALAMDGVKPAEVNNREKVFKRLLRFLPVEVWCTFNEKDLRHLRKGNKLERASRIVSRDLKMLRCADALLVDYSRKTHNYIGCTCEIVYAYLMNKPVIVYVGDTGIKERIWLLYHATHICSTLDSVVQAVRQVLGIDRKRR